MFVSIKIEYKNGEQNPRPTAEPAFLIADYVIALLFVHLSHIFYTLAITTVYDKFQIHNKI